MTIRLEGHLKANAETRRKSAIVVRQQRSAIQKLKAALVDLANAAELDLAEMIDREGVPRGNQPT